MALRNWTVPFSTTNSMVGIATIRYRPLTVTPSGCMMVTMSRTHSGLLLVFAFAGRWVAVREAGTDG